jgi:hypothetical protein
VPITKRTLLEDILQIKSELGSLTRTVSGKRISGSHELRLLNLEEKFNLLLDYLKLDVVPNGPYVYQKFRIEKVTSEEE